MILPGRERTVFGDREDTFTTEVRVSSEPDTHIRSRNVGFDASGMKPNTDSILSLIVLVVLILYLSYWKSL